MRARWAVEYLALHLRLRQARQQRGLTQAEAGGLIDVCERTYREFESGRGDLPAAKIFHLADTLGIRIEVQWSH